MNRIILSVLPFCLLAGITYAQNNNLRNPKSPTLLGLQRNYLSNNSNKLLKTNIFLPAQAIVDTNAKFSYTYDSMGNMLTELVQVYANTTWGNISRNTWTYDNNGYLMTSLSENWTAGAWVNDTRGTYTNDIQGNTLTYILEHWTNNDWVNFYRFTAV